MEMQIEFLNQAKNHMQNSELKSANMILYIISEKEGYLNLMFGSQEQDSEMMNEEDDYKIFEEVSLTDFQIEIPGIVQNLLVHNKQNNRHYQMIKVNWAKAK